jgi:hypothetical protein
MSTSSEPHDLGAEDAKLVTLARGALGRVRARRGAAVRDETGRTYSAADVDLPGLQASAIVLAVATAAASGARSLEAVAVVGPSDISAAERTAVSALGGAPVFLCDTTGAVVATELIAAGATGPSAVL